MAGNISVPKSIHKMRIAERANGIWAMTNKRKGINSAELELKV